MANPAAQGEQWGSANEPYRAAIEAAAARWNVPVQLLLNIGRLESDFRPTHVNRSSGAQGMFQFMPSTRNDLINKFGYEPFDSFNPTQAANAAARYLSEIATGTGAGAVQGYASHPSSPNWEVAAGGYNGGPTGYMRMLGGLPNPEGKWNANYVVRATQGLLPFDQLSEPARNRFDNYWTAAARPNFGGGIGSDARWDPQYDTSGVLTRVNDADWHGDTGQEIGTPNTGFESPLPYAGTGLEGQSLQDWIKSPTGGQAVAGLSERAGYTLTPDVIDFVGRTVPELGRGPAGFSEGNFPWFTPGRISEDVGGILQHHALMPNNLVFNPESLTWDVPLEARFPSNTGIWGASEVAGQLPGMQPGFQRGYLEHLGYGAPEHNQGGLSNAYWGAPNLYGAPSSGQVGPSTQLSASDYYGITGLGNGQIFQGMGDIADMSTPGHTPFDYTQYFGALGNNNNNWALANALDPNVTNSSLWQPDFNQTFGGVGNPSASNANDYYATLGIGGGFAPGPSASDGIANGDANVTMVLADIQSGASNPIFSGSIWSPWTIGDQLGNIANTPPPSPIAVSGWQPTNTGNLVSTNLNMNLQTPVNNGWVYGTGFAS